MDDKITEKPVQPVNVSHRNLGAAILVGAVMSSKIGFLAWIIKTEKGDRVTVSDEWLLGGIPERIKKTVETP